MADVVSFGLQGPAGPAGPTGVAGPTGPTGPAGTGGGSPVLLLADANIASLSGEQTIDGVLTSSSRVLLTAQSTGSQNGIWITGAGAWTRPTDFAAGAHAAGTAIIVEEGTVYGHQQWVCATNPPNDVIGTNALAFIKISAGTLTATAPVTINGDNAAHAVSSAMVVAVPNAVGGVSAGLISAADQSKLNGLPAQNVNLGTYYQVGASPAGQGAGRYSPNTFLFWLSTTTAVDMRVIGLDNGNVIQVGDTTVNGIRFNCVNGGNFLFVANTAILTIDGNTNTFQFDGKIVGRNVLLKRGRTQIDVTAGDVTPASSVYMNPIIEVIGTPVAGRNIILPLTDGAQLLVRNTTGQTCTIKGATGTGAAIAAAGCKTVYCDGTNYYATA